MKGMAVTMEPATSQEVPGNSVLTNFLMCGTRTATASDIVASFDETDEKPRSAQFDALFSVPPNESPNKSDTEPRAPPVEEPKDEMKESDAESHFQKETSGDSKPADDNSGNNEELRASTRLMAAGIGEDETDLSPEAAERKAEIEAKYMETFREASGYHRSKNIMMYLAEPPKDATDIDMFRWKVGRFMDTNLMRGVLMLVIGGNAVTIGVQTDYGSEGAVGWMVIELLFVIVYTLELVLNLIGFGRLFFDDVWNWADILIVVSSIVDTIMNAVSGSSSSGVGVVRLLRVVRVVMRLSRIVKLISFAEKLVLLVESFFAGLANAMWVFLLLILALYVFAVMAVEMFGNNPEMQTDLTAAGADIDLKLLWGTIPRALVTLCQLFSDDGSVSGIQRPMGEAAPGCWLFFVLFMVVVTVGLMELLAAVFIDSLLSEKAEREKMKIQQQDRLKTELAALIDGIFKTFDGEGEGILTKDQATKAMALIRMPETKEMLTQLEIDDTMLDEAVKLADVDGTGVLSRIEFGRALVSLTEPPRSSDVRDLRQRMISLDGMINQAIGTQEAKLKDISRIQDDIMAQLKGMTT